jgi:hypothetical protein
MTNSLSRAISAPDLPASGLGEKLNWDAFSARYFPGRPRHDLDAVAAYGAYRQGRDWRKSSPQTKSAPRLTLVPNEPAPTVEAESHRPALERLLVAVAAEQVWEGEGGFTPEGK